MEKVSFHELKIGNNIWFKNPYASFSHWGTVEDFNYNFEGKPYVNVNVGKETTLRAYENYEFVKED
ncbi:hypothetical protein ACN9U3_03065 [Staphylococcus caprae]|uniref:hypothetical protein n=1 Tax=Staphylococcus caprae TaxID=29380 RepID=UPI003B2146CC